MRIPFKETLKNKKLTEFIERGETKCKKSQLSKATDKSNTTPKE
jgi:hypothetical protein